MGPTIWDESAEFEAVEEISAEVVVHVDSVAEETENCNIHVWSGLTHVLRAGGIGQYPPVQNARLLSDALQHLHLLTPE